MAVPDMFMQCAGTSVDGGGPTPTEIGSLTIPGADLPAGDGTCTVTVRLTRSLTGTIDPAFTTGSTMYGVQSRSVTFQLQN
jgi:hypothetical protein